MKKLRTTLVIAVVGIIFLTLLSCNDSQNQNNDTDRNTEHVSDYVCPMHPEITGIKGETCSICGMDLVPMEENNHDMHNH